MTRVIEEGVYNLNPDGSAKHENEADSFHTDSDPEPDTEQDQNEYRHSRTGGIKVTDLDADSKTPKTPAKEAEKGWFW